MSPIIFYFLFLIHLPFYFSSLRSAAGSDLLPSREKGLSDYIGKALSYFVILHM
jgi:hypothetical protein